ncbi:hypothetical protein EBX93_18630, partial [bacterium]|nr:hypothetical protein [bacterium]
FILGLVQTIQNPQEIVENISDKFGIPVESAQLRFAKFIESHVQIGGQFVNKRSQIVDHPGYECMLNVEGVDHHLHVLCTISDSIEYIDLVFMYFDSYLRASQFPETLSSEQKAKVKQMNKTKIAVAKEKNVVIPVMHEEEADEKFESEEFETKDVQPYKDEEDADLKALFDSPTPTHPSFGVMDEYEDAPLEELEVVDLSPSQLAALEDVDEPKEEKPVPKNLFMEEEEEISISPDSSAASSRGGASKSDTSEEDDDDNGSYAPFDPRRMEMQKKKLANLRLKDKNSNLFLTKMSKLDPVLFSTTTQGKYKSYSSMCQWSEKRQPIILSPKEKERLDKEFPGSIEYALKHGSDAKHQNY